MDGQIALRPAIFLDRDGTINQEVNYLDDPGRLELLPGAAETIARWNTEGWAVVLITNQAGIGRGYFTRETVEAIHVRMRTLLAEKGARLDAIYVCPHHPDEKCVCRKPQIYLFEQAASDLNLDLGRSYLIGDKLSDLLPARQLGSRAILVRTGHGMEHVADAAQVVELHIAVVADLPAAALYIDRDRQTDYVPII